MFSFAFFPPSHHHHPFSILRERKQVNEPGNSECTLSRASLSYPSERISSLDNFFIAIFCRRLASAFTLLGSAVQMGKVSRAISHGLGVEVVIQTDRARQTKFMSSSLLVTMIERETERTNNFVCARAVRWRNERRMEDETTSKWLIESNLSDYRHKSTEMQ